VGLELTCRASLTLPTYAGYKLRKHIAKALQARSKAVKAAIKQYNTAANVMLPPRINLLWEQVVDYTFLTDFDLLCEGRQDIRQEPWALPAGRAAMDQHFKFCTRTKKSFGSTSGSAGSSPGCPTRRLSVRRRD
jgi:hypothetical protein